MTDRIDYDATAERARVLGLTLEEADEARHLAMSGNDGTRRIMYDAERFEAAAQKALDERPGGREVGTYVIGCPVVVTVWESGYVRFSVDLSEVARVRDIESDDLTDEQIVALAATVQARIDEGADYDVFRA